jgi:hypothetical protein
VKLDQTAVTANPQDLPSPRLSRDRENLPRSGASLFFEGVGVGATVGAATCGVMGAVMALGTSLVMPPGIVVPGPVVGGIVGVGIGGVVGGVLGGFAAVGWAMLRR